MALRERWQRTNGMYFGIWKTDADLLSWHWQWRQCIHRIVCFSIQIGRGRSMDRPAAIDHPDDPEWIAFESPSKPGEIIEIHRSEPELFNGKMVTSEDYLRAKIQSNASVRSMLHQVFVSIQFRRGNHGGRIDQHSICSKASNRRRRRWNRQSTKQNWFVLCS